MARTHTPPVDAQEATVRAAPFLKWAGGKRAILPALDAQGLIPSLEGSVYHEPFLGGGAVFLHSSPKVAILSDSNEELITTYQVLKSKPDELIARLKKHEKRHNATDGPERAEYYYQVRARSPTSDVERAARLIYLNRTCYNGLYRVNRSGQFNVPMGRYSRPTICDEANLRRVSRALRKVTLRCQDFRESADAVGPGDYVYCDPPYDPLSSTASFTSYTSTSFSRTDQKDLAQLAFAWSDRGAKVLMSNHATDFIRGLFHGSTFTLTPIQVPRAINSRGTARGAIEELLIHNYPAKIPAKAKPNAPRQSRLG